MLFLISAVLYCRPTMSHQYQLKTGTFSEKHMQNKEHRNFWQTIETGRIYLKHFVPYIEKYDWFKSTIINRVPVFLQAPLMRTVVQSISSFRNTAKARVFTVNLQSDGAEGHGVNSIWPGGALLYKDGTQHCDSSHWYNRSYKLSCQVSNVIFCSLKLEWLMLNWIITDQNVTDISHNKYRFQWQDVFYITDDKYLVL